MTRLLFAQVQQQYSDMGYELVKDGKRYRVQGETKKFNNLNECLEWLQNQVSIAPVEPEIESSEIEPEQQESTVSPYWEDWFKRYDSAVQFAIAQNEYRIWQQSQQEIWNETAEIIAQVIDLIAQSSRKAIELWQNIYPSAVDDAKNYMNRVKDSLISRSKSFAEMVKKSRLIQSL